MPLFKSQNKSKEELTAGMQETNNSLGTNIAELRKKQGLTQEEFATALGVTAQAVSKWENGASCPDIMLLPEIAKFFNVSIDELMGIKPIESKEESAPIPALTDEQINKMKLRVLITDNNAPEKKPINVSVPVSFVLKATSLGVKISGVLGNDTLSDLQLEKIVDIIKSGVTGEILRVDTEDNKVITIEVI